MTVSWHRSTVDGHCVPDATLQVVAAEKCNARVTEMSSLPAY